MQRIRISRWNYYIVIALVAATVGFAAWSILSPRYAMEKEDILLQSKKALAASVQGQTSHLTSEDFSTSSRVQQHEVFSKVFATIQSLDFVRIKVWNKEYVVVWSDLKETIGQQFRDNHEVEEALGGEIELEMEELKEEHVTERQFESLVEVYVPVYDTRGDVIGVLEVYASATPIQNQLSSAFLKLLVQVLLSVLAISGIAAFILRPTR